jgi:tetratricopeptide (TPR) repeat protein
MRLTKSPFLTLAAAGACVMHARAEPSAELLDLAARVHYGFYHGEPRTLDAAAAALERLGDSAEVTYYRDFAALRRAQLGEADRAGVARVRECARRDVPARVDKIVAAETWVLVAACALVAGDERRREQALAFARERDDDNPRIGLVEAWALEAAAGTDPARGETIVARLTAVVEAFDAWSPSIDDPDWGHAEALTALAAYALEGGQVRTARDLLERALLLAPDYRVAVELRAALQTARSSGRAL